jgi:hypothetical protein
MDVTRSFSGWKLCAAACIAMLVLSLIPQLHLWFVRGRDWNGSYVSPQGDELLYSAYLNALIQGRTRKNDPFGGKDDSPDAPLPESIFSIQFVPAYAIALPARLLGISASTAFIIVIAVVALFASLSLFCLLKIVTGDDGLAAAGTIFVLCFGCIVGRHGFFGTFVDVGVSAFPFLRRYQPAVPFPLLFVFQLLVYRGLIITERRHVMIHAALAGLVLSLLIFSHLYLWTASAAWLVCLALFWFYFRPADRRKVVALILTIGSIAALPILAYAYLLSQRARTLDEQQILFSTRMPDLLRVHEVLGALILVALLVGIIRKRFDRKDPRFIYVASLSLLPFILFNQQVVTGKSMQDFHFELAVVNYSTLVGLIVAVAVFWEFISRRLLIWISVLSFMWGLFLVSLPARLLFVPQAIANDQRIPVLLRLKELSAQDGTLVGLQTKREAPTVVFSPSVALIALMPTWTSQGTLLDITGVDCRGITREERRRLFYMHMYYSKTKIDALRDALSGRYDKPHEELASVQTALFGYERTTPAIAPQYSPIRPDEVEREIQSYQSYVNSFSKSVALTRPLTHAVTPVENFDFGNLDQWYERDGGERVGDYVIYRLRLR